MGDKLNATAPSFVSSKAVLFDSSYHGVPAHSLSQFTMDHAEPVPSIHIHVADEITPFPSLLVDAIYRDAQEQELMARCSCPLLELSASLAQPTGAPTPISALQTQLARFFSHGSAIASAAFQHLQIMASLNLTFIPLTGIDASLVFDSEKASQLYPWWAARFATALILLFAARPPSLAAVLRFLSVKSDAEETLRGIENRKSQSLHFEFGRAKSRALRVGQTTVIGVSLVDLHHLRHAQRGSPHRWLPFGHCFAVAIGPDGVVVWSAHQQAGITLQDWILSGGSRVRNWDEAWSFTNKFHWLTDRKHRSRPHYWAQEINQAYLELFGVDIIALCAARVRESNLRMRGKENARVHHEEPTPVYHPWVGLHVIQNVGVQDIEKFRWA